VRELRKLLVQTHISNLAHTSRGRVSAWPLPCSRPTKHANMQMYSTIRIGLGGHAGDRAGSLSSRGGRSGPSFLANPAYDGEDEAEDHPRGIPRVCMVSVDERLKIWSSRDLSLSIKLVKVGGTQ